MDPFKLLSRSTKLSRTSRDLNLRSLPSDGPNTQPQLFARRDQEDRIVRRKRKRGQEDLIDRIDEERALEFFGARDGGDTSAQNRAQNQRAEDVIEAGAVVESTGDRDDTQIHAPLAVEERKRICNKHKLKVTWLNPEILVKSRGKTQSPKASKSRSLLYPDPLQSLQDVRPRWGATAKISSNVAEQGFAIPTEVQLAAIPLLLDTPSSYLPAVEGAAVVDIHDFPNIDLLTVAPTGSGKTLAFMIPLLYSLLSKRSRQHPGRRCTSAVILAPTKELAAQITNEGRKLTKGTALTISQMRKGMRLPEASSDDADLAENDGDEVKQISVVKADILVSTPGLLQSAIDESRSPMWQVQHLVLDEADVLLDPLFREQTLDIWNSFTDPDLRVSMWSATMGSNIEELAKSTIKTRLERLKVENETDTAQAPLIRLVVGLKDSAVPNVRHDLIYAGTEKGKLLGLRQLLHPVSTSNETKAALRPPFLVFTQTIERARALHAELLYDIPAEAGGSSRIAVLHSDLSDATRDSIMTRFRKGEIWILITTDLLSRGVDFRGVNGVVNYDIPTSSAAYVHRIGRTGRAGRDGGVAVTLYSKEDIPYLKHVANVASMAQKQKGSDSSVQPWLLNALPRLSKIEKQNLKKRGVESRTARGQLKDPKVARRSRISTKSGFTKQAENKRRGAILGSQSRQRPNARKDASDEVEFSGFD